MEEIRVPIPSWLSTVLRSWLGMVFMLVAVVVMLAGPRGAARLANVDLDMRTAVEEPMFGAFLVAYYLCVAVWLYVFGAVATAASQQRPLEDRPSPVAGRPRAVSPWAVRVIGSRLGVILLGMMPLIVVAGLAIVFLDSTSPLARFVVVLPIAAWWCAVGLVSFAARSSVQQASQ